MSNSPWYRNPVVVSAIISLFGLVIAAGINARAIRNSSNLAAHEFQVTSTVAAEQTIYARTETASTAVVVTRIVEVPVTIEIQETSTPAPPSPTPTVTPLTPTLTPTTDSRLISDNFENGLSAEWGFTESGVHAINGNLVVQGYAESYIQGYDWTNYSITIEGLETRHNDLRVRVREQDRDNYLVCRFYTHWNINQSSGRIEWIKVINGQEQVIPHPDIRRGGTQDFRIEVDGSTYRTFVNGERVLQFTDNTFEKGTVNFHFSGDNEISIDSIEVRSMR